MNEYPHMEERDGTYYIRGQRVPLISIILHWNNGDSPEAIRQKFPTLTLAEVYAGVVYYLDHQEALDQHFAKIRAEEETILVAIDAKSQDFRQKIRGRVEKLRLQREISAS
jgi:uncharacterized protein (DUF433 family)